MAERLKPQLLRAEANVNNDSKGPTFGERVREAVGKLGEVLGGLGQPVPQLQPIPVSRPRSLVPARRPSSSYRCPW